MTTPYWGNTISIQDVNNEIGNGSNQLGMDWVRDNTKDGVTDLNSIHDRAWYQRNVDGNCDNGNCTSNCNCGNICCTDCYIAGPVDCANCDGRAWLQGNCNCACTYNCYTGNVSYNCNCNCRCNW